MKRVLLGEGGEGVKGVLQGEEGEEDAYQLGT